MMRLLPLLVCWIGLGATPDTALTTLPAPAGTDATAGQPAPNVIEPAPVSAMAADTNAPTDSAVAPDPRLIGQITEVAVVSAVNAAMDSMVPAVESLSSRLSAVEQMVAAQAEATREQARTLQDQSRLLADQAQATRDQVRVLSDQSRQSSQTALLVVGCFATALLLGVLIGAMILARAVQRVSEIVVSALPPSRQLGTGASLALTEPSALDQASPGSVDQVTQRFLGAIDKLEKRILELEHATHSPAEDTAAPGKTGNGATAAGPLEFSVSALHQKQYGKTAGPDPQAAQPDPVQLWLGKGQALVNLEQWEEALACFDRALELNPDHADAHVKRGMVLERMEKIDAALASYDQAIAADESFTLAYLYKGAVCNRLQRYREALECYESALKCEQKLAGTG